MDLNNSAPLVLIQHISLRLRHCHVKRSEVNIGTRRKMLDMSCISLDKPDVLDKTLLESGGGYAKSTMPKEKK